ncbi:hypothetical protein AN189_07295 [Loktanella sp. 3ANDIMAR09]|uniref:gpW family head-tail joining protein n=1 Tax=Loktanella sp. 3ANDIMAR09 TaxID=1225657 RepID=UPI0006FBE136|nr:gpW family head-tail joining protein [Loktanella sp. 3ANDIMAR09]KQI68701.1 hypothetical protein AN189_07295 [Loktanella sp. 3ANDIMAR09]
MAEQTACERLAQLKKARDDIAMGKQVSETRFGEDGVKFGRGDLAELNRLIQEAERECAIEKGKRPPRRFAVATGGHRRWP